MKRDDTLWKGLIEDLFPEFLEFFYPRAVNLLDEKASFEFLDKELQELFPTPDGKAPPKFVDKLVRVRLRTEEENWALFHVEVQGYPDKNFAERMFEYYYRIRDRYGQSVTALAIFAGNVKSVGHFEEECLGCEVFYRYNVFDIRKVDEEALMASKNPFSLVVLAAKAALLKGKDTDKELMRRHTSLFEVLETWTLPQQKKLILSAFLVNCVQFVEPETYRIFNKQLESITGKNNPMGVVEILEERGHQKGLKEGLAKAQEQFVTNLLAKLHLSDEQIADIAGVDLDFVQQVKQKLPQ